MAEPKTKPTDVDPIAFIERIENETRRKDAHELVALLKEVTGESPKMWGPTILGFGQYHYKYESGREADMLLAGFSPRKANLVVYLGDVVALRLLAPGAATLWCRRFARDGVPAGETVKAGFGRADVRILPD